MNRRYDPDAWDEMEVWAGGVLVGRVVREERRRLIIEASADRVVLREDLDERVQWLEVEPSASPQDEAARSRLSRALALIADHLIPLIDCDETMTDVLDEARAVLGVSDVEGG